MLIPGTTSLLSLSVPGEKPLTVPLLGFFIRFLFIHVRGPTFHWTSSLVYPSLKGNSVILTIIERFSKAGHFVALSKLPSALETANLLVDHVFRLHGLPADIVSDRGPQFTSQVWRQFCKCLGATVSLSSGFHPQSNG